MTLRGDTLDKLVLKTGGDALHPLLPKMPDDNTLEACQGITYDAIIRTLPMSKWPNPTSISVIFGKTQQMIFESTSGTRHASFVSGLSRGAAVVGILIDTNEDLMRLQHVLDITMPAIGIGDEGLPSVAPWLVRPLVESAANIAEKTDSGNLSNVLAFNYGIFWAAAAIVPPQHTGRQTAALKWLQSVTEYFGGLGIVPS